VAVGRRVEVGALLPAQHSSIRELRDRVDWLEDAGADAIFTWDHFFPATGDPHGAHFECWMLLASWAERTRRAQLGSLVSATAFRRPELLAAMVESIDAISDSGSGGRLILGLGAGWREIDFHSYGYEFGTLGERMQAFGRAVASIAERLRSTRGVHAPRIPILIGGGGERVTLGIVAQWADIWHCPGDVHLLRSKIPALKMHLAAAGRAPESLVVSQGAYVRGGLGPDEVRSLEGQLAMGVSMFTFPIAHPSDYRDFARLLRWRDSINGR
jgi:probable F420-dependent oxidoreductase